MEDETICFRCGRNSYQVKLIDAIYGAEIQKICEECAMTEQVPIIRKPSSDQLKNAEKPYSIRRRLSNMAGLPSNFKPEVKISDYSKEITLDKLRKPKDYKAVLEKRFESTRKRNQPLNLIENYNWHIIMARKNRKITRKQLADVIGESETVIKMIEENFLPDDALRIINKIEQYFGINLRKGSEGILTNLVQEKTSETPAMVLKFDPKTSKNITIDDLRKMKQAREENVTEKELKKEFNVSEIVWKAQADEKVEQENLQKEEKKQGFISRLSEKFFGKKEEKSENQEQKV